MGEKMRELLEVESIVVDKLLSVGYPRASIVMEGQLDARRFVDILISDIESGLPVMIVEIKSCSQRTLNSVEKLSFESLKRYYEKLKTPVKAVAAIFNREKNDLEFIDFTEAIKDNNFERKENNYVLPSYDNLTVGAEQKILKQKEAKQKKSIDILKIFCWYILPPFCLMLLILDAFNLYVLSHYRVLLIGMIILIVLLPCFSEITIGEISLKNERKKQKEEQNNG